MVTGSIVDRPKVKGKISPRHQIVGRIRSRHLILGKISVDSVPYGGEYTITPTEETQTLNTHGLRMSSDVIVNPIPDNYARMSWDGTTLYFY